MIGDIERGTRILLAEVNAAARFFGGTRRQGLFSVLAAQYKVAVTLLPDPARVAGQESS
jgi:hypothetical protein